MLRPPASGAQHERARGRIAAGRDDHNGSRGRLPLILAALMSYLIVVVIAIAVNVPLRHAIKAAGAVHIHDVGGVRERFHDTRWVAWNLVRAADTTSAFACLAWRCSYTAAQLVTCQTIAHSLRCASPKVGCGARHEAIRRSTRVPRRSFIDGVTASTRPRATIAPQRGLARTPPSAGFARREAGEEGGAGVQALRLAPVRVHLTVACRAISL